MLLVSPVIHTLGPPRGDVSTRVEDTWITSRHLAVATVLTGKGLAPRVVRISRASLSLSSGLSNEMFSDRRRGGRPGCRVHPLLTPSAVGVHPSCC